MLSKNAQFIQDLLHEKKVKANVIELPSSARTAEQAADALGCEVAQIVKSLIFQTKETKKAILILTSGINRVNEKKIETILNEKITKADANFTREVTGFAIGGIPPIGHKEAITTFIDEDLLQYEKTWAAAGTPHAVFDFDPSSLPKLTGGTIITLK